jgi:N-acyl-phosphatidylethanolamine-hydrolysing phospholipase D
VSGFVVFYDLLRTCVQTMLARALAQRLQERLDRERVAGAGAVASSTAPKLPRSTKVDGRFVHDPKVFPRWEERGGGDFLKWRWAMRGQAAPLPPPEELERLLPVLAPDAAALGAPAADRVQATWLGHASVLVQWQGWTVLADPIFSERCSPVQWAGPRRVRPAPLAAEALPPVDVIVISHNHYDHLDAASVRDLARLQPHALFCVPLGMKCWFEGLLGASAAAERVVEFDWSEQVTITEADLGVTAGENAPAAGAEPAGRPPLTVVCVPCQHWCSRTPTDRNKCLWSSWIVKTDSCTFWFGGGRFSPDLRARVGITRCFSHSLAPPSADTGYAGEIFRSAAAIHGPVQLAAIPIAAYGVPAERWFHKPSHMDPEEAVATHEDLKAAQSIAIHWGTFLLTGEPIMEPPQRLAAALEAKGLAADAFVCLQHGETRAFDLLRPSSGPTTTA